MDPEGEAIPPEEETISKARRTLENYLQNPRHTTNEFTERSRICIEEAEDVLPEAIEMLHEDAISPVRAYDLLAYSILPDEDMHRFAYEMAQASINSSEFSPEALESFVNIMLCWQNDSTISALSSLRLQVKESQLPKHLQRPALAKLGVCRDDIDKPNQHYMIFDSFRASTIESYISSHSIIPTRTGTDQVGLSIRNKEPIIDSPSQLPRTLQIYQGLTQDNPKQLQKLTNLEYLELHPNPYLPTVGSEIEIATRDAIPADFLRRLSIYNSGNLLVDRELGKALKGYRDLCLKHKIPFDPGHGDGLFELSLPVSNTVEVQARLLYELGRQGYLNPEQGLYTLHLNLGGLEDTPDLDLLAMGLTSTGWATSADRLSHSGPFSSYAYASQRGYRHKDPREYDLLTYVPGRSPEFSSTAVELRVHMYNGISDYARLAHSAQYLGSALKAFQKRALRRDHVEQELALAWSSYSDQMNDLLEEHNIDTHVALSDEKNRQRLGKLLDDPGERGTLFTARARELTIQARQQIQDILNY